MESHGEIEIKLENSGSLAVDKRIEVNLSDNSSENLSGYQEYQGYKMECNEGPVLKEIHSKSQCTETSHDPAVQLRQGCNGSNVDRHGDSASYRSRSESPDADDRVSDEPSQKRPASSDDGGMMPRAKMRKSNAPKKIQNDSLREGTDQAAPTTLQYGENAQADMEAVHFRMDPSFNDTDDEDGSEEEDDEDLHQGSKTTSEDRSFALGEPAGSFLNWWANNSDENQQNLSIDETHESTGNGHSLGAAEPMTRRRKCLTLEMKIDILRWVDENKYSKAQIADHFGIPKSTLSTIVKSRDRLISDWFNNVPGNRKKTHISPYNNIEQELYKWIWEVRSQYNGPIQGSVVRTKALELARELGNHAFTASNGWLSRFKHRHRLPILTPLKGQGTHENDLDESQSSAEMQEPAAGCSGNFLSQDLEESEKDAENEISNQSSTGLQESVSNSPSASNSPSQSTENHSRAMLEPSITPFQEFEMYQKSLTSVRSGPRKRRALTVETKLEIIRDVDEKIKPRSQILADHGIPSSTLWTILKSRDKLLIDYKNAPANCKRMCSSPYSRLESELYKWICEVKKVTDGPLKEALIKAKALEIAHAMGHTSFSASSGWLHRFKHRYKYNLRNSTVDEDEDEDDECDVSVASSTRQQENDDSSMADQDLSMQSMEDQDESDESGDNELSNHSTVDSEDTRESTQSKANVDHQEPEQDLDNQPSTSSSNPAFQLPANHTFPQATEASRQAMATNFPMLPMTGSQGPLFTPPFPSFAEFQKHQMSQSNKTPEPQRRKSLTLESKIEIIRCDEEKSKSRAQILAEYGISSSTLWSILKSRDKLLNDYKNLPPNCKRVRNSPYRDLERELYRWICEVKIMTDDPIKDGLLKAKAFQLAQTMGLNSFSASNGWLQRFKYRYNYNIDTNAAAENEESQSNHSVAADDDTEDSEEHVANEEEPSQSPGDDQDDQDDSQSTETNDLPTTLPRNLQELQQIMGGANFPNNMYSKSMEAYQQYVASCIAAHTLANLQQQAGGGAINNLNQSKNVPGAAAAAVAANFSMIPSASNLQIPGFPIPGEGPLKAQGLPRRRNDLTLKMKVEILRRVDESKKSRSQIAKEFGIPKSSLTSIVKFREKIWNDWCSSTSEDSRRARITPFQEIEKELYKWICDVRATYDGPIKDTVMKAKALEIARRMGNDSFTASSGWVYKFKQRMGIPYTARKNPNGQENGNNSNSSSNFSGLLSNEMQESIKNVALNLLSTQSDSVPTQSTTDNNEEQNVEVNNTESQDLKTEGNNSTPSAKNSLSNQDLDAKDDSLSTQSMKNLRELWFNDRSISELSGAYNVSIPEIKTEKPGTSNTSTNEQRGTTADNHSMSKDSTTRNFMFTSTPDQDESGNNLAKQSHGQLSGPMASSSLGVCDLLAPYLSYQTSPHKRKALALETKVEILRCVDENKKSRSQIASDFGIPLSTLSTIIKSREKLMNDWCRNVPGKFKRVYDSRYGEIESDLYKWIREMELTHGGPVKGPEIKAKALEIANSMGHPTFTASNGWLHRFKQRYGFPVKTASCPSCDQPRHTCQCVE